MNIIAIIILSSSNPHCPRPWNDLIIEYTERSVGPPAAASVLLFLEHEWIIVTVITWYTHHLMALLTLIHGYYSSI